MFADCGAVRMFSAADRPKFVPSAADDSSHIHPASGLLRGGTPAVGGADRLDSGLFATSKLLLRLRRLSWAALSIAVMTTAVLGGGLAVVTPARAQTLPTVTIEAERASYGLGIEDVVLLLDRTGSTDAELEVSVSLSQAHSYLDSGTLQRSVTFSSGASGTVLIIRRKEFSNTETQSGDLTATLEPGGTDYAVGTPSSATTRLVAADPAMTIRPELGSYVFAEGADATNKLTVVARTEPGIPPPNGVFRVVVLSEDTSEGARPVADYAAVSELIEFTIADFEPASGGVWAARKKVALSVVDDTRTEPDESLTLFLDRGPDLPGRVQLREADGATPCASSASETTPATARSTPCWPS